MTLIFTEYVIFMNAYDAIINKKNEQKFRLDFW